MDILPKNERLVELNSGLEGVDASLSSFASDISSGISGMHVDSPDSSKWSDDICTRTANIMRSVDSLLDAKKSEAESISSAAGTVKSLKTACEEYLKYYSTYEAAVKSYNEKFEGKSPPEDEEKKKEWEEEKKAAEDNINAMKQALLGLENSAKSQEDAVKGCFSGGATAVSSLTGNYDAVPVTGSELSSFCENNYIDASRVTVKKAVVDICGTSYDVYYVYDNQLEEFDKMAFNVYVNDSIKNLGKSLNDPDLVKSISNTYLIFEEDQGIDLGGAYRDNVQAWFLPGTNSITSWFSNGASYDYGVSALVHEYGHAVDSYVGYSETGSHSNLSSRDFDKSKWMQLAKTEGDWTGHSNTYPYLCPSYSGEMFTANNGKYIAEYVAEAFAMYNYSAESRNELKLVAPGTYQAIEELIKKAKA